MHNLTLHLFPEYLVVSSFVVSYLYMVQHVVKSLGAQLHNGPLYLAILH